MLLLRARSKDCLIVKYVLILFRTFEIFDKKIVFKAAYELDQIFIY